MKIYNLFFLFLFLIFFKSVFCQIAGEDITICEGSSGQLNADSTLNNISWFPNENLSDPYIHNPIVSNLSSTSEFIITTNSQNQIINGDFELGNTSFITDYTFSTELGEWGLLSDESTYAITHDANLVHNNFQGNDHTNPPNGNFLVVNGAEALNAKVWCQTISIEQNTQYEFSTWLTSVHFLNPAILEFTVNGEAIGEAFTASNQLNVWNEYYALWDSELFTSAEVCITNLNSGSTGNDFGIDDISFKIHELSDTVTVFVIEKDNVKYNLNLCEQENGLGFTPYDINNLTSNTLFQTTGNLNWYNDSLHLNPISNSVVNASANLEIYASGDDYGCKKAVVNFNINSKPKISTLSEDQICVKENYNFSDIPINFQTTDSIESLMFYNALGVQLPANNYSPESSMQILIICETEHGCKDTSKMFLIAHPLPKVEAGINQTLCVKSAYLNANALNSNGHWIGESNNFISNTTDPNSIVTVNNYGQYNFYWEETNEFGCKNQDTTTINFTSKADNLFANFNINKKKAFVNEEIIFTNTSKSSISSFWDFGNGIVNYNNSYPMRYDTSGLYEVKLIIQDSNGCLDSISKYVLVKPYINLYIPLSFSPNEDGKNDIFEVYGDGWVQYDMKVFSRWGEELYHNKNLGWNGKYKANYCQDGIYCYKIKVKDFENKTHYFYGEFSLIR